MNRVWQRVWAAFGTVVLGALLAVVPSGVAHADSCSYTNEGVQDFDFSYKTASAGVQVWTSVIHDCGGGIDGTLSRARIIDNNGMKSYAITAIAARWQSNNVTIERNGNTVWAPASPGQFVYSDTNNQITLSNHNNYYQDVTGVFGGGFIRTDVAFTIRWGDDAVINYTAESAAIVGPYSCSVTGTLGSCGTDFVNGPIQL